MTTTSTDQVDVILTQSSLDAEDQELWREYLKWAPPFLTERFIELFKSDVHDLPEATIDLRQKIAASDDASLLQVILDKELAALKTFFNNNQ